MSKPIPTLSSLVNQLSTDIKSKLQLLVAFVLRMVVDAFAAVLGAQFYLCYLLLQDNGRNQFPDTADTAANGGTLERQGMIYLERLPYPTTDGVYTATVTGTIGTVVRAGLTFKSNEGSNAPGNLYITDTEYTLPGSSGIITVRSLNAGPDYRLNVTDTLTVTEPVIGLDETITIAGVTTAPQAGESEELYRQNILDAIRLEPQGGAKTDYRIWAADAQGVQRVFPYVKQGDAGVVQVYVEATPNAEHGVPSEDLLDDVEEVLNTDPDTTKPTNARGRRPMQAILEVLPVVPKPVDVIITSLATDTSEIRSNIRENLESFLFGVRPYIAGADLPADKNDVLTTVKLQSVVTDTIGNANTFLGFTMSVDGGLVNTYTFGLGDFPYLRNVTYA